MRLHSKNARHLGTKFFHLHASTLMHAYMRVCVCERERERERERVCVCARGARETQAMERTHTFSEPTIAPPPNPTAIAPLLS